MDFATIYTYGHIDAMFHTLNGVAMIMNSPFATSIIKLFALLSLSYATIKAALGMSANPNLKAEMWQSFILIAAVGSILSIKSTLKIVDEVNKEIATVDNLPIVFTLPIGVLEGVGRGITILFEQAFSTVSSFNYTNYGSNFGANLVTYSRTLKLQNPMLATSMENFLDRCVYRQAAIGHLFTLDDLFKSTNIWDGLLKNTMKDGDYRKASVYDDLGQLKTVGCKSAYNILDKQLSTGIDKLKSRLGATLFGQAGNDSNQYISYNSRNRPNSNLFFKNLEKVFANYWGTNMSGADAMRQIMLMHQFAKFGDFGTLRAIHNQETAWQISAKIADYYLPMLLTVLKCLLYACIVFVIPMIALTGSLMQFKNYLLVVFSFQLWPALYAVLNMFTDLYSGHLLSNLAGGAVSLATYSNTLQIADQIVAISGGLQIFIPLMAAALAQGGLHGLVHLAGNLSSTSTQAATSSAHEVTSGNRSFDNVQMRNVSGYKTDLNSNYKADSSSMQRVDGSISRTLAGGESLTDSGHGLTRGMSDFSSVRTVSTTQTDAQSISNQIAKAESAREASSRAQSHTFQEAVSYAKQLGHNKTALETWTKSTNSEDSRQALNAINAAESYMKNEGLSEDLAYQKAIRGHISGSLGFGFKGGSGANIGFEASTSKTTGEAHNTGSAKQQATGDTQTLNDTLGVMNRLASDRGFNDHMSINESSTKSMQQSYQEMQDRSRAYNEEQSKLNTLANSSTYSVTTTTQDTYNVTEQRLSEIAKKTGSTAHDMQLATDRGHTDIANILEENPIAKIQKVDAPVIDNTKFTHVANPNNESLDTSKVDAKLEAYEQNVTVRGDVLQSQMADAQSFSKKKIDNSEQKIKDRAQITSNTHTEAKNKFNK